MKEIDGTRIWEEIHHRVDREMRTDSGMCSTSMAQALIKILVNKGVLSKEDILVYRQTYKQYMDLAVEIGTYSLLKSPNMKVHVNSEYLCSIYRHLIDKMVELDRFFWVPEGTHQRIEKEAESVLGENWDNLDKTIEEG